LSPKTRPDQRDGRGSGASDPAQIPSPGWRDVLTRTGRAVKSDQVPLLAAGVGFFGLLALVPALAALISLYGLVGDPSLVETRVADLMSGAPREARELVTSQARSILEQGDAKVGVGLVVSVVLALWAASSGMKHLVDAVNLAYDEDETRGFLRVRTLSVLLTLGLILFVGVAIFASAGLPALGADGSAARSVFSAIRWGVLALGMVSAMAALYRYAPDRGRPKWAWTSPGALGAALLWIVGSVLFSIYTANFASYNETYGVLGGVVITMLWLYLTAFAVIAGAELNCEAERQTAVDSTTGRPRQIGERDAYAADTAGPATTS